MPVPTHQVGLGRHRCNRGIEVGTGPEQCAHLVHAVDEGKGPHIGELASNGMGELEGEPGKGRHRARDVAQQDDLWLALAGRTERRLEHDTAVSQAATDGPANIEAAPLAMAASLREPRGQAPRQRGDRLLDGLDFLASSVLEVDLFDEWRAYRPGHVLCSPLGDEPSEHLGPNLTANRGDHPVGCRLLKLFIDCILGRGEGGEQHLAQPFSIDPSQHAVLVIAPTDRPVGIDPGKPFDRFSNQPTELVEIIAEQGVGQSGAELIVGQIGRVSFCGGRSGETKEDVARGVECRTMSCLLHHGGGEGGAKTLLRAQVRVFQGICCVHHLDQRYRHPGLPQFRGERGQPVDHESMASSLLTLSMSA